jgi:hypothetical protein
LVACPCLAFVANVVRVANAASGISDNRRLWFLFDFAIIIRKIPFFLWQKYCIAAMPSCKRALGE